MTQKDKRQTSRKRGKAAEPPVWSRSDLVRDRKLAIEQFREARLREPQQKWIDEVDRAKADFQRLLDHYGVRRPDQMSGADIAAIFRDHLGHAYRYVLGPPVSNDDLVKIAGVVSLAPQKLDAEAGDQESLLDILKVGLDPTRFPWVSEKRDSTDEEFRNALNVSAALFAAQRVQTHRRMSGKDEQEESVKRFLRAMNFREVPASPIQNLAQAPAEGAFSGEALVGTRKADVPVRLFDGRLMAIECKVSNSELNSIKRINNDAAVKAKSWIEEFGRVNVVPVAVLTGVFGIASLEYAQERGLTLFWAHNLEPMRQFIDQTCQGCA